MLSSVVNTAMQVSTTNRPKAIFTHARIVLNTRTERVDSRCCWLLADHCNNQDCVSRLADNVSASASRREMIFSDASESH